MSTPLASPSYSSPTVELPLITVVPHRHGKILHKLEAKKVSYELCSREFKKLNWACCDGGSTEPSKYILRNVNCKVKPGKITAIVGPSGAGKTTLLEIIAGVISPSTGQVLLNGQAMDTKYFRRISGYVSQEEALFPLLTVEETLMYCARLRLPGGRDEALARVSRLLIELGLEHIAHSRIGLEGKGISGGEKRRVSIGVDLVHDPSILLIDEPTSGLDSGSALHVVSLLKSMAVDQGKTVLLTIHQPGFRILELIDQVVLLSNGIVLHHGSLNSLDEHLKFVGHCIPLHVNVLEFAIDIMTSPLIIKTTEEAPVDIESNGDYHLMTSISQRTSLVYPNSMFAEVVILGQRFCSNIFRSNQLFAARMIQALLAGIVLGTIFMNHGDVKLQPRVGFFAFTLTFLLSTTIEGLPIFLEERKILMREISRAAYRLSSYILANTLIFLPFLLTITLLYTTPVYWVVGLRREIDGFFYFSLVVWMAILMANSFVACFSALVPNFIMGNSLIAGCMGSFFLFSGYFISEKDIPRYWKFMHYFSLFKYPFECFLINEYGGEKGKVMCADSVGGQCVLYGDEFLKQQGLEEYEKWSNLGVMLAFILGYRVLCFVILLVRCHKTRN